MNKTIKTTTSALMPSLAAVNSVANNKSPLQSLKNVLVTVRNGSLSLVAGDGEMWLRTTVQEATVECDFSLCVEAKLLMGAVRQLGDVEITLEADEEKNLLVLAYGNGKLSLPYEEAKDFPMPNMNGDYIKKHVDAMNLKKAIDSTVFVTTDSMLKPALGGVRIEFPPECMRVMATDEASIAIHEDMTVTHNGVDQTLHGFTLPKKPASILSGILTKTLAGDVSMSFSDNAVLIGNAVFSLYSVLIGGKFPNCLYAMPKNNDKQAVVDREALLCAIGHIMPVTPSSSHLIKILLEGDTITVQGVDYDFGTSGIETVECEYDGDRLEIGINGSRLMKILGNIDADKVVMTMMKPTSAVTVSSNDAEQLSSTVYCMMPMVIKL